jgi:hypothetical protein
MMSQAGVLPGPGLTGKAKAWCSRDTRDANIWAMMRFMGVSSSNHLQRLEDWQLLVDKRLRFANGGHDKASPVVDGKFPLNLCSA